MATITARDRLDLIGLFVGFFNAAPGATNLGNLVVLFESGMSVQQIANTLAQRAEFAQVYPSNASNAEFAAHLTANLLDAETGAVARQWATTWIGNQLNAGSDRPAVIVAALRALKATANPDFASARQTLFNKVDVAAYYSMTKEMSSTSLAELQNVIREVDSSLPSVIRTKTIIGVPTFDPIGTTYTLTDGADVVVASTGNDTIVANQPGTLSAGDSIDGAGGLDTLRIYDPNGISLPASITVKQVETASLWAVGGIMGDMSNWNGLLSLDIQSLAGDVTVIAAGTTDVAIVLQGDSSAITGAVMAVTVDVQGGDAISITSDATVLPTVFNPHSGMTLAFGKGKGVALSPQQVSLPDSQPGSADLQQLLDKAAAGDGTTTTQIGWYVHQGDTYVVADNSASATYVSGTDAMVKLVGIVDVGSAMINVAAGRATSFMLE